MQDSFLDKADTYLSPVLSHFSRIEIERAEGIYLYGIDGKKYIDCASGIAVANTGHAHPKIQKAIAEQASKFLHLCAGIVYYPQNVALAEALVKRLPFKEASVFFTQSGSEAIETSLKLALYVSKKKKIVVFDSAFHGRTMGALSLTAKEKYKQGYDGWLSKEVIRVPYPYCYRCPYGKKAGSCDFSCVSKLKTVLLDHAAEIAAVFIEPVLGEGGYVPAPVDFMTELRYITKELDILLAFDEIQTGFGRTGTLFAMEQYDVCPDIVALAKGIASGLPLGACVARKDLMDKWTTSAHGGTYTGNPVSCAAGLATLKVIDEEKLLENAYEVGQYLKELFLEAKSKFSVIGDVRGFGLMLGIELIKPDSKEPNPELLRALRLKALEKGLIIISCGDSDQVIRFIPPLTITKQQAKQACDILLDSLAEVLHA